MGNLKLRQGETLLTSNTKNWSQEFIDANNTIERCIVFLNFRNEDQGRSRERIAQFVNESDASRVVEMYNELIDEIERLKTLLIRCQPYMRDLNAENFNDTSVGIYEDTELSDLYRSIRMEIEGITDQDIADTSYDEPKFK